MYIIDTILLLTLSISLYTDTVERKIYNKVTVPAAASGLVLNFVFGEFAGLKMSFLGMLAGMAVFFLPFIMGGIAAGDVKLMGAVGALKGPVFVFHAALFSAVAGGIISLALLLYRGELLATLRRMAGGLLVFALGRFNAEALNTVGMSKNETLVFPYGTAIFLGVIFTLVAGWSSWLS